MATMASGDGQISLEEFKTNLHRHTSRGARSLTRGGAQSNPLTRLGAADDQVEEATPNPQLDRDPELQAEKAAPQSEPQSEPEPTEPEPEPKPEPEPASEPEEDIPPAAGP